MAGRTFVDPISGLQIVVLTSTADSQGALLRLEFLAHNATAAPDDHVHAVEEEQVEVQVGTVHCRIAGQERVLQAGERIVIPPGTPHAVWAGVDGESRSIDEFRPAGAMEDVIAALFREV